MSGGGPVLIDKSKCVRYPFGDKTQFTIGRALDSSLVIASKIISRHQCLFKYTKEMKWALQDLSSFNSTRVNNKPLRGEWQTLNSGDLISFVNYDDGEYIFYEESSLVPVPKKRKLQDEEVLEINCPSVEATEFQQMNSKLQEEIDRLAEVNKVLNENYQKLSAVLEETQKSLENVEGEKTNLSLKLISLNETNTSLAVQLQERYEALNDCEFELERAISEKISLQEAMKNGIENVNKNSQISVEFNAMKEELEAVRKELVIKDGRLNEVLAEKDILYSNISDVLEVELSCTVCSEVLYQATTLQCRHTFCAKCLATWKRNKKECPVCRTRIKSEVMPLIIDSFIDRAAELIGNDFKKRRDEIRQERGTKKPGHAVSPYNFNQNRRGRRNSRNSTRWNGNNVVPTSHNITAAEEEQLQRLLVNLIQEPAFIDLTSNNSPLMSNNNARRSGNRSNRR